MSVGPKEVGLYNKGEKVIERKVPLPVKWIFVVLLICSLTAFVEKDKPTGGLSEGDVVPDFKIESTSEGQIHPGSGIYRTKINRHGQHQCDRFSHHKINQWYTVNLRSEERRVGKECRL